MFVTTGDIGICHATSGNVCNNPARSREYETKRDFENEKGGSVFCESAAVLTWRRLVVSCFHLYKNVLWL